MGGKQIPHVDSAKVSRGAATVAGSGSGVVPSGSPSATISSAAFGLPYDWGRLERAVAALVAQHERYRNELRALRAELGDRESRIRRLEAQLIEGNQKRQDAVKRIDELISQLDQLDAQLANAESVD